MTNKLLTRWIAGLPLVLGAFIPNLALAAVHVELAVDNTSSPARLYVILNDSQCPGGPADCIEVKKGDSPNLYFDLDDSCKASGPEYQLHQFRIAMQPKAWPSPENPLPAYAAQDFNADPNSGYVDFNAGRNSLKPERMKLKDSNSQAYEVHYEITAIGCNGEEPIRLDPSVRNTGK